MGKKMKATYHSGRTTKAGKVFNANHNTYKKTRDGQSHINHDRTDMNVLYRVEGNKLKPCDSYDCIEFEKEKYRELFSDSLKAKNERYIKQRHKERCREIEDLYKDPKKCPFEMILQIGKSGDDMNFEEKAELSKRVNLDFIREMYRRFGANLIPLDISGHYDEISPHWHYRAVFVYQGKDGLEPNQTKALESMGIERPDKEKPIGKHNNPLMTFTAEARELYYDICERYGLEIDREVKSPSQKYKETLEHKCEMLEQQVQEKDSALEQMTVQLQTIKKEADKEAERHKVNKLRAEKEEIRAIYNAQVAEKLVTRKTKQGKDNTINIGLKQYQEATAIVQETKKILESEVYTPTERKEMRLAAQELEREKARYRMAADSIEEQIEQRAEAKANARQHAEKNRIEKLEQELARERHDKNYICEMIKRFLPEAVLERFEQFSGIILHNTERIRSHTR